MNPCPLAVRLVVVWLSLGCGCVAVRADGGTVRLRERKGLYEITVFTAPTPFRAGPVDISVLLQDAGSGEPIPEDQAIVTLTVRRGPRQRLRREATSAAATNKLLRSTPLELPGAGRWDVEVTVTDRTGAGRGEEKVHFAVEAAEPLPPWATLWPWLTWPALVVALFGLRRLVVRRAVDS
jgi:hypothetical protein